MGALLWSRLLRRRLERQHSEQLSFSRQILQSQEGERSRIAANLHDGLGQNLLVIKNQACLAMHSTSDPSTLRRRLEEISGVAAQAIEEVRQVTLNLQPYYLDRLGLAQAIRATVARASENSEIVFACHVEEIDGLLERASEVHLFRIFQEAVNNVVKHSAATEATVVVKRRADRLLVSVRDNGQGFAKDSQGGAMGFGLNSMAERARILGGKFECATLPGGVALTVEIPIPNKHS